MTSREGEVRLTSTRSTPWSSAQSDLPAGVPAAAAGALDELVLAGLEAGCPALLAETLPQAARPIRAVTAIRPRTPRESMRASLPHAWTVRGRPRFRPGPFGS